MKPIKSTIPIRELQTLIRQWRDKGLKETTLPKVLELYLGLPNYMTAMGEYPVHFFYDLSVSLKFRTVIAMLEAIKQTGSFGWEPGENRMNMSSFYSPLWKECPEKMSEPPAEMQAVPANLQKSSNVYNINNKSVSPSPEVNPSEEGRNFFHEIKKNPMERKEYLDPIIAYFKQQDGGIPHEEACADVVYLVNELLIPHFIKQEKFMQMKHNGRLAWLRNLLKSGHGKELVRKAAEAGKQRRSLQRKQALDEVRQNNRPLSPYEWMDPETKTRFYEDESEGVTVIPVGAPPRPNEEAFWNVIQQCWV